MSWHINLFSKGTRSLYYLLDQRKNDHNSKKIYDNAKALGINFVNVPFPNKYLGGFIGKLWMLVLYAISLPFAVMKIKVQKFDIVHAHYPVTTYIPAFLRFFNKKKKIYCNTSYNWNTNSPIV